MSKVTVGPFAFWRGHWKLRNPRSGCCRADEQSEEHGICFKPLGCTSSNLLPQAQIDGETDNSRIPPAWTLLEFPTIIVELQTNSLRNLIWIFPLVTAQMGAFENETHWGQKSFFVNPHNTISLCDILHKIKYLEAIDWTH